jgi:hypothetical protein
MPLLNLETSIQKYSHHLRFIPSMIWMLFSILTGILRYIFSQTLNVSWDLYGVHFELVISNHRMLFRFNSFFALFKISH